jgi:hypothetical protein
MQNQMVHRAAVRRRSGEAQMPVTGPLPSDAGRIAASRCFSSSTGEASDAASVSAAWNFSRVGSEDSNSATISSASWWRPFDSRNLTDSGSFIRTYSA